jgi:glucose/mannose-6-phosphate isomerase
MSVLDQPESWTSIDPRSMRSLIESFPGQVEAAAQSGLEFSLSLPRDPRVLVITGLGGSAIGGDLVRSIAGRQLRIPLVVNRDYDLPGFIDPFSLVIACSYSGNTEETLSAYRQARQARAHIFCITSGGHLEAMAKADGCPVLAIPGGLPPRAALGYSLITLLYALKGLNLIPDITGDVRETIQLLKALSRRYAASNPESDNPAKKLARSLFGKIAAIYGSNGIMDAAAFRWRCQIAENAKNLGFHHVLPELNHNELVGWLYPEEALKKIGVVLLRDREDHSQVQRRFDLTRELIADKAGSLDEVWSEGDSLLARIMSIIYLGDFVSLYLAYLNNADPMPVKVIDFLKAKLSTPRERP